MIYELVEDLQRASASLPASHPGLDKIVQLRDAALRSIMGLTERPDYFAQSLSNALRTHPVAPASLDLIAESQSVIAELNWHICATQGIADTKQWTEIIAVSPRRNVVHCIHGPGQVADCRLDTQQIVAIHHVPVDLAVAVSACPTDGRLAALTADGIVHTNDGTEPVVLRRNSNCFAGFDNGFLGIDAQNSLLYWDQSARGPITLAAELPALGCVVAVNGARNAAVVVAGDRPATQKLLLIQCVNNEAPSCRIWPRDGAVVSAACIDDTANILVLATIDRALTAFDIRTSEPLGAISLAQSPGRPLDEVTHCACTAFRDGVRVVFAVLDGIIGLWDTDSAQIRRAGRYHSIESAGQIQCLDWLADGEHFIVATGSSLRTLHIDDQIDADASASATAITACAIGADGWQTLIHEKAQRVTWIKDGVVRKTYYNPGFFPRSVASNGMGGAVVIGGVGTLATMRPDRDPGTNDALDIFYRPVVAVLPRDERTAAAVCDSAEIKLVRIADEWIQSLQDPASHWVQAGACLLAGTDDIVCWGHSITGSCERRAYVLRSGGNVEEVFGSSGHIVGVASTLAGPRIHVASDSQVTTFEYARPRWRKVRTRDRRVTTLAAFGDNHLLVTPTSGNWLELWSVEDSLNTVAVCYMPVNVRCIAASGNAVLLGTKEGQYVPLAIHRQEGRHP